MNHLIQNLSMQPIGCIEISAVSFFCSYLSNYMLLTSLLKMHRSKSAVKKIRSKYTLLQKLRLRHFKENCLHAVSFCSKMVIYQKISFGFRVLYWIISLLFAFGIVSSALIAWLTVGFFFVFDLPVFLISLFLSRPIIGRFKEFTFEKYHNTQNHDSLF